MDRDDMAMNSFMMISLLTIFYSIQGYGQDMGFLSPGANERYSVSLEHQMTNAPGAEPDLTVEEQRAGFSLPVYSGESSLALTARGQRVKLGKTLVFPTSNTDIPDEFGTADFGVSWAKENLSGDRLAASASYGSAGTRLFDQGSSVILTANLFFEDKKVDHSWMYFLNYSNNRTFLNNIPIPGFAYSMSSKTYTAVLGVPFLFFSWRPDPFSLTTSLSPFGANLDSGFRVWKALQVYANTAWSPKSYQNLVEGSDDRLIFDRKEAGAGLRMNFGPLGSFSAGYVYGFDRRFMLGKSTTDDDAESFEVGDAAGFQIKGRASF